MKEQNDEKVSAEFVLGFVIDSIIFNAESSLEEWKEVKSEYNNGRCFMAYEMLDSVKNWLIAMGYDPTEYGIYENLENRYVIKA